MYIVLVYLARKLLRYKDSFNSNGETVYFCHLPKAEDCSSSAY